MKYIDADKLTKAIEDKGLDCSFALKMERLDILALIDSLQHEQPEVDLEKEIEDYWEKICDDEFGELIPRVRETAWFDDIARHFYELGLNARKEE